MKVRIEAGGLRCAVCQWRPGDEATGTMTFREPGSTDVSVADMDAPLCEHHARMADEKLRPAF